MDKVADESSRNIKLLDWENEQLESKNLGDDNEKDCAVNEQPKKSPFFKRAEFNYYLR